MKPRATEQPTETLTKPANRRNQNTNHNLGQVTPGKGFPKGNCPASERKPRSSARKRLDRKGKATHSRKGALTTDRPLLVNACLTGETCAKHIADIYYTASGLRAENRQSATYKQSGRVGPPNALHIFSQARIKNSRPLKKKLKKKRKKKGEKKKRKKKKKEKGKKGKKGKKG